MRKARGYRAACSKAATQRGKRRTKCPKTPSAAFVLHVLFAEIAGSVAGLQLRLAALPPSNRPLKVAMLKRLQAAGCRRQHRGTRTRSGSAWCRCRGRSTGLVCRATNALQSARLPTAARFPGSVKKSTAVVIEMTKGNPALFVRCEMRTNEEDMDLATPFLG